MENRRKLPGIQFIKILLAAALVLSLIGLILYQRKQSEEQRQFSALESQVISAAAETEMVSVVPAVEETTAASVAETLTTAETVEQKQTEETETQPPRGLNAGKFSALTEQNSDFAGWLKIEGTSIDYPVMLSTADPDFYLDHGFDREYSFSGTPFIDEGGTTDSDNVLIYAHNMKNGTMFSDLIRYENETYFRQHPEVCFDSLDRDGIYQIIAVFKERVHYNYEENVFRFYDYSGDLTEEKFREYLMKIREASLYETDTEVKYGTQLITLVTCAYHEANGRFVVVAAKQ